MADNNKKYTADSGGRLAAGDSSIAGSIRSRSTSGLHPGRIGLPTAQACGFLQVQVPAEAGPGTTLLVEVPGSGGQSIAVEVPPGCDTGGLLTVPYEISASGLAQHPLQYPQDASILPSIATIASLQLDGTDAEPRTRFCSGRCCMEVVAVVVCAVVMSIAPAVVLAKPGNGALIVIGLVLSAILPTAVFMSYCYCKYRLSLLKQQMVITFLEAAVWLVPFIGLFIVLSTIGYFTWCTCEEVCPETGGECERVCAQGINCYFHDFFTAFILASLCEEILKFLCIRRITFASLVVDAQGLFVYGGCGALGFATVENVLYVMSGGVETAAMRAVLSVPLHLSTGVLMGCSLGYSRFFGKQVACWRVLIAPVLVHGFYDIFLFVGVRLGGSWAVLGFLLSIAVSVVAWMRIRMLIIDLEAVPSLDVRALIKQGVVQRPSIMCCMCCWESAGTKPVPEGGERRLSDDGNTYTFKQFVEFFGREEALQRWSRADPEAAAADPETAQPQVLGRLQE